MILGPPLETLLLATDMVMSLYRIADDLRDGFCLLPKIQIPKKVFGASIGDYTVRTCYDLNWLWDIFIAGEMERIVSQYAALIEYQYSAQQDIVETYLRLNQQFRDRITLESA